MHEDVEHSSLDFIEYCSQQEPWVREPIERKIVEYDKLKTHVIIVVSMSLFLNEGITLIIHLYRQIINIYLEMTNTLTCLLAQLNNSFKLLFFLH